MRFGVGVVCALLLGAASAEAKLCGDDVDGVDVPCACGDIVVSDVVLGPADPVTQTVCPVDALVVRAPSAPHGVTVDLHGQTLRGLGRGTGLWLAEGGPGGARVVSTGARGRVEGFRDGIVAKGTEPLALLSDIDVLDSARDGARLWGTRYEVRGLTVRGSKHVGYHVMGERAVLDAVRAEENEGDGLLVMGSGHDLRGCTATGNGGRGIGGQGVGWRLSGNEAVSNGDGGLVVHGRALVDAGGNRGSGNGARRPRQTAVQCEIGGLPCTP